MKKTRIRTYAASTCLGCLAPFMALAQPIITTQPTNHFANTASSFTFFVGASGTPPLSYQWLFNGAPIAGASRYYLTVTTPQPTQWGYYSVTVTNLSGSVTSQPAELKIFTAARHSLSGIQAEPDGSMNLTFAGETTATFGPYYDLYPLECSTNLVDWAPLATLQRSNSALDTLQFADTNAAQFTQRFYRTPTNQLATPAPAPTGPYSLGTFSMVMSDSSRTNNAGGTNYQFMTTFWYPTVPQAGVLPASYMEPQVALCSTNIYNMTPWGGGDFRSQAAAFFSHSLSSAPLANYLGKYPVVLYDQGFQQHRRENTDKVEELVSWGYVVVGVDESDTVVSVFPDGKVVYGLAYNAGSYGSMAACVERRVRDLQFVLEQLAVLNGTDPRVAGRLDLDRIGAFGWSLGGATVAQLCLREPRCKAGAALDGAYIETNVLTQPLAAPYLFLRSGMGVDPEPSGTVFGRPDDRLRVYNRQITNAYWVKLGSTTHISFGDVALIADSASLTARANMPLSGQYLAPARVSQVQRAYLLSFFNKFLKDQDDHLLDGPSAAYPEVIQFLSTSTVSAPPAYPKGGLLQGSDGSLYGTTAYGGSGNNGTVFRVTTNGILTPLVLFSGANGSHPMAGLLQGSDGNLYGTTDCGGTNGDNGTVFQLTTNGVLTTLVCFNGTNGSHPLARLMQASDGNFYGTTHLGGANDLGTVFRMTPSGVLTTLLSFNGTSGRAPVGGLAQGSDGNFYGTAWGDAVTSAGKAFRMTPDGVMTTLVSFTGGNGYWPSASLLLGTNDNFYGTTELGGNLSLNGGLGFGAIFKMTSGGALTTLVSFGGINGSYCASGLVQGTDGNFYGTTAGGGGGWAASGGGTVFKMTPTGTLTTLVSFNGVNGNSPQAPLIQGSDGNFYGTTTYGGPGGGGTVFQVTTNGALTTLVAFGSQ